MYNHKEIEKKWQEYWDKNKTFKTNNPIINLDFEKEKLPKKYYVLDMFPYPSGAGLHVGHPEGYTANDIIARYMHALGYNVLHPMGWDAFGLPAENYAIKTGTHPKITTEENIGVFKKQIKSLGFSYDWDREIDTTDPNYYKWTQWIFSRMFEEGLAYEQDLPINFCPSCKTGLANEEVLGNGTCERCGAVVEKKKIRQWVLAITKYADRLAKDVEDLDWPEGIKDMQRQWIGRSEGCQFDMRNSTNTNNKISVYTTRIDTVFGMTYAVIAPDHKDIYNFIIKENYELCNNYIVEAGKKSDLDRTGTNKDKTGVFTGSYVINPFNNEKVPLWIADYVLGNYGTGAVMAVPAHDERDYEFAIKYGLEIRQSIKENIICEAWTEHKCETADGILYNSGQFSNMTSKEARIKMTEFAEENGFGFKKVNYKLRDWLFSRQRYWGEPIPLIHIKEEDLIKIKSQANELNIGDVMVTKENDHEYLALILGKDKDGHIKHEIISKIYDGLYSKIILDKNLPIKLPEVEKYEPSPNGQSPLARVPDFVNVKIGNNLSGERETNTMPQWGGSCWYYLRFMDSDNNNALVGKEAETYWGSVDSYVGGAEHAVLHLLYARFWHKFLYDIGIVSTTEPFAKLRNQGLILAYAYRNSNGALVANDLVKESGEKYYNKETGEELEKIVAKMSKSLKNVVNPDDIINEFGADALRLYEMYISDFKDSAPWDTKNIIGIKRFLDKVWNMFENRKTGENDEKSIRLLHKTIKKVSEDIENYKFNTAIASLMILTNYGHPKDEIKKKNWLETFIQLLHPFAPHMAEELWKNIGHNESIFFAPWPKYDKNLVIDDEVEIAIQVLGKLRGTIKISKDDEKDSVIAKAKENEEIKKWLEGKEIVKEIYVPGKIVNFVVR